MVEAKDRMTAKMTAEFIGQRRTQLNELDPTTRQRVFELVDWVKNDMAGAEERAYERGYEEGASAERDRMLSELRKLVQGETG